MSEYIPVKNSDLENLTPDEIPYICAYANIAPDAWINTREFDFSFFEKIGFPVHTVTYRTLYKHALSDCTTYCYTINGDEGYIHISKQQQEHFLQSLFVHASTLNEDLSSVFMEYVIRKLAAYFFMHHRLDFFSSGTFVGVDSSYKEEICDLGIEIDLMSEKTSLSIVVSLPYSFSEELSKRSQMHTRFFQELSKESAENDVQLRFDLISFPISTNSLIDIVKGGALIPLPAQADYKVGYILYGDTVFGRGTFHVLGERIVFFNRDEVKEISETTYVVPPTETSQSRVTISLGYFSYSLASLTQMANMYPLDGCVYPQVQVIVGNEVIAQGELCFFESSRLCVKVTA